MKDHIVPNKSHEESRQLFPKNKAHLFNLDFHFRNEHEIAKFLKVQNKQLFRMTSSFHIHHKALLKLSDHFPRKFYYLKHLKFDDNFSTKLPTKKILQTSKYLGAAQSLTRFEISNLTLNQAAALAPFIKGFKRLESISLDLCDFTQNHFISGLFSSLTNLKELKNLKFFVKTGETIRARTLRRLSAGLSRLKTLQSIDLDLSGLNFDADQDFFFDFRYLRSLSSLTFKLSKSSGMNDRNLADIARSIEKVRKLEKLGINLSYCRQITNKGIGILSSSFPSHLKSLNLDLGLCEQVKEKALQSLFCSMCKMTFMEDLSLWFSSENALTDQGLLGLNLCLSGFKRLKSLLVSVLNWNLKINNSTFDEFLSVLASKTSLKNLVLQFPGWSSSVVDSKRLEKLGDALVNLKKIENLELNFRMRFFEDDAVDSFSNKLKSLEKLQNLHLDFSHCGLSSVKVLEGLIKTLEKLKDLRKVTLNFQYCLSRKTEEVKKILPNPKTIKFELLVVCENTFYSL